MEAFPFTEDEWAPIRQLAQRILAASSAGDDALYASLRLEMLDGLAALRAVHGDHPVLLETAADYTDHPAERAALYRRAIDVADAHGLPALGIRLSFAPVLTDLGEPGVALDELRACGGKAAAGGNEERGQWASALEDVAYDAGDDAMRAALYRRAREIAAAHGCPTVRLRLLLVRFLLDVGKAAAAMDELRSGGGEPPGGDEQDRKWWGELVEEAGRAELGAAPGPDCQAGPSQ